MPESVEGDIPGEHDPRFVDRETGEPLDHELVEMYRKAVINNKNRHNHIQKTYGEMLRPDIMEMLHQQAIFDYLLPVGTEERLRFEIEWQGQVSQALEILDTQIQEQRKPKLATPQGGLILPDGTRAGLPDLRPEPEPITDPEILAEG